MKLNMSMIEAYLKRCRTESSIQSNARTIRGVRFLTEDHGDYSRDYVYISDARSHFKDPRYENALILASGRNHIVCQGLELEELLNDVLSAFDFYNDSERRLALMAAWHAPLSEMATVIGQLIEAPFLVFGINGEYLGGCHLDQLPDEGLMTSIRERGSLGAGNIGSRFVDNSGIEHHDLSAKPKMTRGPKGQMAVNMYLYSGHEPVGFAMCFPLNAQHTRLAFALEPPLADYLVAAREFIEAPSRHQALHLALTDLLKGKAVADEISEKVEQSLGGVQRLSVVLAQSLQIINQTQRMLLAREVSDLVPACIAAEIDDAVAFLVPERQSDELVRKVLERFDSSNAAIGVSMPVVGMERLPIALRQARFALGESPDPGVHYCRDLALPFLLRTLRDDPTTQDLLHPAISILTHYDAEHHTSLMQSLKAYLDAGFNQVEGAKMLHVHLNTLKYRLKRVEEITTLDIRDRVDMLYLQISLELQA